MAGGAATEKSRVKGESKILTKNSPEVKAAREHILNTVGPKVEVSLIKAFNDGSSVEWTKGVAENSIRVSLNSDVLGTAYHESLH